MLSESQAGKMRIPDHMGCRRNETLEPGGSDNLPCGRTEKSPSRTFQNSYNITRHRGAPGALPGLKPCTGSISSNAHLNPGIEKSPGLLQCRDHGQYTHYMFVSCLPDSWIPSQAGLPFPDLFISWVNLYWAYVCAMPFRLLEAINIHNRQKSPPSRTLHSLTVL